MGDANSVVNQYIETIQQHDDRFLQKGDLNSHALRSGTEDVKVMNARLLDGNGNPTSTFNTGETLTLEMYYYAKKKLVRPTFGVALYAHKGDIPLRITTSNTKWQKCSPPAIEGKGMVKFTLPALPLLPGNYSFWLAIKDDDDLVTYDRLEDALHFRVGGGMGDIGSVEECGLLYYPGEWQCM
jgi:hypothetical protein